MLTHDDGSKNLVLKFNQDMNSPYPSHALRWQQGVSWYASLPQASTLLRKLSNER